VIRRLTRPPRLLARGWAHRVAYFLAPPLPADYDDAVVDTIVRVRRHTMTSPARLDALIASVEHLVSSKTPGAIAECGVWRGGSMMAIALTLLRLGDRSRELYLFDTYSGMTEPGHRDVDSPYDGFSLSVMWRRRSRREHGWHGVPAGRVRQAMASTGYPVERMHFVEGRVEETLPAAAPSEIALLRLDTDWYASTRHALEQLYPRLVPGGVLLLDDYGHYPGARSAVDEYLAANGEHLLLHRVDYTGRVALKR